MTITDDFEKMARDCPLNPRTCGMFGSVVTDMTPLCLKEWQKGSSYHPFCYKIDSVSVRL